MKVIKVTSKGQVTLPQEFREKLNITEGTYLVASINQNGILLKPAVNDSTLIREHCKQYASNQEGLERARQILSKVPNSLSEQTRKLRDE